MKKPNLKFCIALVFVLTLCMSPFAKADWFDGDPYKMHYPQLPMEIEGLDIALFSPVGGSVWLADDWECTETGPVSDIHFWVSWYQDDVQPINGFSIRIWSDNPTGLNGWSEPNEVLWEREFYANDITVLPMPPVPQGWYDPYSGMYEPLNHSQWAQVNITDIPDPFIQEQGEVYWLMIDMWDAGWIGWKQSGSQQFRDDAVFFDGLNWIEMFEPNEPDIDDFWITLDPSGGFAGGGGSGYVDPGVPTAPWYYYDNTGWWNQWYYDGIFDPNRDKVVHIEFYAYQPYPDFDSYIEVALNWSTPEWPPVPQPEPVPPLPPLTPDEEDRYIRRETLLVEAWPPGWPGGFYSLDYVIRDYNPEWVSIDVTGYNFSIDNGMIEHSCVQSLDLAFVITGGLDFGDLPDPNYPTLLASDGARHVIGGPWFDDGTGTDGPDPEPDGQPVPPAFGDDLDGNDDEDGLTLPTLIIGQPVTFPIIVSDPAGIGGMVEIWIDYNIDGDLDDAGELAYAGFLPVGLTNITITAPSTAIPGMTYARGRISTAGTGSPRGLASDGEVEDTEVYIEEAPPPELDYGDLPDPNYPTLLASNGARHIIGGPWMGDAADGPDPEPDGQPTPNATGDDLDGNDDEDGLIIPNLTPGQPVNFNLQINNVIPLACVEIWIDYNIDGDLDDAGELAYSNFFFASGNYLITINVPAAAVPGMTFARGRISMLGTGSPRGQAPEGEVEDTEVYIEEAPVKPEAKHLKWSQPPIEIDPCMVEPEYCGWNEESWTQEPCEPIPMHSVADDFHCIGPMPVESIHFWGSYIGWEDIVPPLIRPTEWEFTFYANVPAPSDPEVDPNYSHPGALLWKVIVPDNRVFTEWVGYDYYPTMPFEPCFQHYVDLEPEEYFLQDEYLEDTNDDIYWLGIRAVYPNDVDIVYPWGWKTRPESWTDDAVKYECRIVGWEIDPDTGELIPIVVCRYWPIKDPMFGESFDVAFELDTDPNYIKWEQPYTGIRDWPHYEDRLSQATVDQWTEQITKWSQKPDLEDINSLDVDATIEQVWKPQVLADDFPCTATGEITDIQIWGSWYHDHPPFGDPTAVKFTLSIHADVNALVSPTGYSMPGTLLWQKTFQPGEFMYSEYEYTDEGWFVPCADPPVYIPYADTVCWWYSFTINATDAFTQEEGNIYWLDVQAEPMFEPFWDEPIRFGWKNSLYEFMDDGVWAVGSDPPPAGQWNELIYPSGHPYAGASINLAFQIGTDFLVKYIQEPELEPLASIDVDATKEEVWQPQVLADDFECTNPEPLTDIHIWGSWYHDFLPYGDPNNVAFTLSIHKDIPADENPDGYSIPGDLLWTKRFEPGDFDGSAYAWDVYEGWFVPCSDPNYYEEGADYTCWQYDFYIDRDEAFHQEGTTDNPIIYWLDVQAEPNQDPFEPTRSRFGWKTSCEPWNDDGVWAVGEDPPTEPWNELRYPEGHPLKGESINLAFEITGEIVHEDNFTIDHLAADDWLCERRTPVIAIAWYGSYIGYRYQTPCGGILQPPPVPPDRFIISIYEDVAADDPCNEYTFSHPGRKLWQYAAYDYDEVLVGYDKHPEGMVGPPREPVYRYSVKLPEDKWFRQREINDVYWISILAVYPTNVELNHQGWGWTIHPYVFGDDAVHGHWSVAAPDEWIWEEIFDQTERSADLSFILFTDPNECVDCADYNWDGIVNFYDYAIFALDWMWTGPAGGYANGDLNCNGQVDFEDLEKFCLQWLDSCP